MGAPGADRRRVRWLSHLFRFGRLRRVLPHRPRAAVPLGQRQRARGGRGRERRPEERRRAARDLHRKGRHRIRAGRLHRDPAGHLQAWHHGRGGWAARQGRRVPRPHPARQVSFAVLDHDIHSVILGYLGAGALLAGLVLGGFSAVLSFWAGWQENAVMIQVGRRAFYGAAAMIVVAGGVLEWALVSHDFSLAYVTEHTDLSTPMALVAAGFYGGQEGSLLYWALVLGILGSVSLVASASLGLRLAAYAAGVMAAILSFLLVVLVLVASPFDLLSLTPPDGLGLNPVLRDGGMLIHPPIVLAGFASFAIPFSFAAAALLAGRPDSAWIAHTRRFALIAWSLQTTGLVLGMWWAYHVLGWGGYWGWDPVENVALMPWLPRTPATPSSQVQEKRGRVRAWNFGLVMLAFLLVVFGTFIVRSVVVQSVHTFAISAIGPWFLGFLFVCIVFSVVLLASRADQLGGRYAPTALWFRRGAFALQNLLLIGVVAVVIWGTVLPLVSGMVGQQRVVSASYYERAAGPLLVVILALMAAGPLLPC